MNKNNLIYIGIGIGVVLLIKNSIIPKIITPTLENVDVGMDNMADFYVKKEMAWNEFWNNSDTMKERYDNFLIYLGFGDG